MSKYLKLIYALALIPLLSGSLFFFFWLYNRKCYANNVEIEIAALISILLFVLLGAILWILFIANVRTKNDLKEHFIPLAISILTIPIIDLYQTSYEVISEKAYVRVINDIDKPIQRIWSANFEITYDVQGVRKSFILSYTPVYTIDWAHPSSDESNYHVNDVYMDIHVSDTSIETFELPTIYPGACKELKLSDIVKRNGTNPN